MPKNDWSASHPINKEYTIKMEPENNQSAAKWRKITEKSFPSEGKLLGF